MGADRFPSAAAPRTRSFDSALARVGRERPGARGGAPARVAGVATARRPATQQLAPGRVRKCEWASRSTGGREIKSGPSAGRAGDAPRPPATASQNTGARDRADALYRLAVTVNREFAEKLKEARALVGNTVHDGDLARVLEMELDALLESPAPRSYPALRIPRRQRSRQPAGPMRRAQSASGSSGGRSRHR